MLFSGVSERLRQSEHLIFVPFGPLDGLPLPALLTAPPSRPELLGDDLSDSELPWLIRQADLSSLPSVSAIVAMRTDLTPSAAPRSFLGIGNPRYGYVDPALGALPPLPETEAEIRFMGALLRADSTRDLLLGDRANKVQLASLALDEYRIVAFATHGFVADQLTGAREPGLALAGSTLVETLLTSSDVAAMQLDAELVILSACSTASSDGTPGAEGLSGLASSFFYAGARGLLVTHWEIPSGPALDLSTGMIAARDRDASISWAQALRTSVLGMLDQPKSPLHAHPVSWAGHFLVGAL